MAGGETSTHRERLAGDGLQVGGWDPLHRDLAHAQRRAVAAPSPQQLPGRRRARVLSPDSRDDVRRQGVQDALDAAFTAAGVEATMRPLHDLRHTAITNDAAA